MNLKKFGSAALTATTVLWMVGAAALPLANAQTTSSLQAQIAALLAQIQTLQSQLGSSSSGASMTYDFTSDLTVGSTGAQVTALQQFLIDKGYLTAVSAPTGYFGSLTQAALAKFQAANGITPSVGYFGPKTMAFINSMSTTGPTTGGLPTGCTTNTGYSPVTGASCATGIVSTPTGAPLTIGIDPSTPGSTNLANGAVNTPVLKLDFTAGATPVTVTNLVLTRTGLSQDSDLDNVYLYSGATKLASNLGFNNGAITFSNGSGLFTVPANSTEVITVTVDVDKTASSGHILQIGLASAANVTGGTFSGNFPLESAQFTIASVSNLATLTISGQSSSTITVNAGQTGELVGQFNLQAGNNPVKVTALNFTQIGSVQSNYLQNIKLMDGSTQLGATISSLGSGNVATFDLSGAPLMLTSGQSVVLSLYADVTGGVQRTFQFSIQQSSDVQAVDTNYGVGIGASLQTGSFPVYFYNVSINNGGLVISKDAATPTTYAVAGNTNQVLAKFDVLASGDSIKFNQLDFSIAGGNTVNNFRVVDDQGTQIGTTQNVTGATYMAGSGSLNYIIPANTTRVLTVYGDLPSNASGTIGITLNGDSGSSAQSYTTFASVGVSQVGSNTLSVLSSNTNLIASANYGLGSPVQAPASGQAIEIGSYTFTAGQVNPVNLTGITVTTANNSTWVGYLRNLKVLVDGGSTQVGNTYSTLSPNVAYNFNSGAPIEIPANGSLTLDVYADIGSGITATTTSGGITSLTAVNASTLSGNSVALAGTVPGQNVTFSNGGTLTAAISATTPQASFLGMTATNVPAPTELAQYQFTADNNGNETLTQVNLTDSVSAATSSVAATDHSTFWAYELTDTSGDVLSTAAETASGTLAFSLSGLNVPANGTAYVNLLASPNSYPYASSSATHAFALNSFRYTNASLSTTTNVTTNNIGNLFTVYQTTLGIAAASFSSPTSISGVGNTVGAFNFSVGAGVKNVQLKSITLATNGSLIQASTTQVLGIYDGSTLLATSSVSGTSNATFTLTSINSNAEAIGLSSAKTLLVEPMSSPTGLVSVTSGGGNYQVILKNVTWSDGVVTTITGFSPSLGTQIAGQSISGLSN